MKLLKMENSVFTFRLLLQEKQLLLAVLGRYPLIPSRHQPLSKSAPAAANDTDQRLLDEALAEHRKENQGRLKALLLDERHFIKANDGWRLVLKGAEMEWLLQVLNDIRVGSWVLLGAPEKDLWDFELNEDTAPHAWAMEIAGRFQMELLEALSGGKEKS